MTATAEGVLVRELHRTAAGVTVYSDPQRCDEIGCPCVVPKQLTMHRAGRSLTFHCPSSRIAATLGPHGIFVLGGQYTGS